MVDGGRTKWELEKREVTREVPHYTATSYTAPERDDTKIRAFREQVLAHVRAGLPLVDVRSPGEYSGELLHMPNYPQEGALRGGHIPGAQSVPWARAANPEDGTFKSAAELKAIYEGEKGLNPNDQIIAYCRIGERSSHSWFVLTYLLGYKNVRNYDGSWTEWGNSVGVPIEKSGCETIGGRGGLRRLNLPFPRACSPMLQLRDFTRLYSLRLPCSNILRNWRTWWKISRPLRTATNASKR